MTEDTEARWFKVGDTIPKGWTIVAVFERAGEVFAIPPRTRLEKTGMTITDGVAVVYYKTRPDDPPAPR